jgi:hypothetical protein
LLLLLLLLLLFCCCCCLDSGPRSRSPVPPRDSVPHSPSRVLRAREHGGVFLDVSSPSLVWFCYESLIIIVAVVIVIVDVFLFVHAVAVYFCGLSMEVVIARAVAVHSRLAIFGTQATKSSIWAAWAGHARHRKVGYDACIESTEVV